MKTLKKLLLATSLAGSLIFGATNKLEAQNYGAYIKNSSGQEYLTMDSLEKNNALYYSLLKKNQDSLMKKVKSFIGMTQ